MKTPKVVVLTGAGMSAESGISTFRDANGLWENHKIEDVATPEAFIKNPQLVLNFYNARRKQLFEVSPNNAHIALASFQQECDVVIITQNVDDLHKRAGSRNVIHLHGELRKSRSSRYPDLTYSQDDDISIGDLCERGSQLRPDIVWFGEAVPLIEPSVDHIIEADAIMVIGSSMQVYPAAGLVGYASESTPIFYIDPFPQIKFEMRRNPNLTVIAEKATIGLPIAITKLREYFRQ